MCGCTLSSARTFSSPVSDFYQWPSGAFSSLMKAEFRPSRCGRQCEGGVSLQSSSQAERDLLGAVLAEGLLMAR